MCVVCVCVCVCVCVRVCRNLPAKCVEEAQRHKQEYEEMVAGAKRRGRYTLYIIET